MLRNPSEIVPQLAKVPHCNLRLYALGHEGRSNPGVGSYLLPCAAYATAAPRAAVCLRRPLMDGRHDPRQRTNAEGLPDKTKVTTGFKIGGHLTICGKNKCVKTQKTQFFVKPGLSTKL